MSTKTLPRCTAMALWVALALSVRLSAQTITTFDAPGAGTGFFQGTFVNSMNPAGTIAGFYTDANYVVHGFLRAKDGAITAVDPPGSAWSNLFAPGDNNSQLPVAISPIGNAIAGYFYDANFAAHGFLRSK